VKKTVENIIFGVLLLILLVVIFPKVFVVVSDSMEPVIKTGSIVFTTSVDVAQIKIGDIVAFTSPSNPKEQILHRIFSIKSTSPLLFKTKGDHNNYPDPWDLMGAGILGKQIFIIPYLGYFAAFIKTPLGFILLIVLPALWFIISQIFYIKKQFSLLPLLFLFLIPIIFAKNISAKFFATSLISQASFSTQNFAPPTTPDLLSPANNSFLKSDPINISWSNTSANYYIYQSSNHDDFSDPYTSDKLTNTSITTSGTPDYIYYWHVKSCNQFDICSPWSTTWHFTVDDTPPTSTLNDIPYNTNKNPLNLTYNLDDLSSTVQLCYSYNLTTYFCQNNFDFTFPNGDGAYYFYSQATDVSGNIEPAPTLPPFDASIIFDTIAPTTNLIIGAGTTNYSGQSLLNNANWITTGNVLSAGTSFQLGVGDSDSTDILVQKILLPHNLSSNLTFSYNFTSADFPEYDYFNVRISTGSADTNIINIGFSGNTGWQTITHSLLQWAGQTIDIIFKLVNSGADVLLSTSVLLKYINISPLDLRTGDTTPAQFLATDLGSGIDVASTSVTNISSIDLAGNIESTHSISIVTLPSVVLNKITQSTISIYNNTDSMADLNNWVLDLGSTNILINTTIPAFSSFDYSYSVGTTTINLKNNLSEIIDSTSFNILGTAIWQRQSNGLGPWIRIDTSPQISLQNRLSESKITLTISGLGDTSINMDYSINYSANNVEQQIAGTISPNTIDQNNSISRDFYLGTCSTGTCLPTQNIGSTFVVNFSHLPPQTFVILN